MRTSLTHVRGASPIANLSPALAARQDPLRNEAGYYPTDQEPTTTQIHERALHDLGQPAVATTVQSPENTAE